MQRVTICFVLSPWDVFDVHHPRFKREFYSVKLKSAAIRLLLKNGRLLYNKIHEQTSQVWFLLFILENFIHEIYTGFIPLDFSLMHTSIS